MRKKIFILLVFLFTISIDKVWAKVSVEEEIEAKWNSEGKIASVNVLLKIPSDCNNKVVNISSDVFSFIKHYKELVGGDNIEISFIIENNSSYDYSYIDNSLFIGINENNEREVVSYRTFNTALKDLYNYVKVYDRDLVDEVLYTKLSKKGYLGDRALELYYLNYYNKKYHMNKKSLKDFPIKVKREIFSGTNYGIYESDKSINRVAYDYFYKYVLFVSLKSNNFKYSIYDTKKKRMDVYFRDSIDLIKKHSSKKISGMVSGISLDNYTLAFSHYNYLVDVKFKLGMD